MKSDILCHYIDGFVIEESDTPFSIGPRLTEKQFQDVLNTQHEMIAREKEQKYNEIKSPGNFKSVSRKQKSSSSCEKCGRKLSKQYEDKLAKLCLNCSNKAMSVDEDINVTEDNVFNSPPASPSSPNQSSDNSDPRKWTVNDVWNYIYSIPVASKFADEFKAQEIDGSALLLLRVDHLISSLHFKLGPAIKLSSHIDTLRDSIVNKNTK